MSNVLHRLLAFQIPKVSFLSFSNCHKHVPMPCICYISPVMNKLNNVVIAYNRQHIAAQITCYSTMHSYALKCTAINTGYAIIYY